MNISDRFESIVHWGPDSFNSYKLKSSFKDYNAHYVDDNELFIICFKILFTKIVAVTEIFLFSKYEVKNTTKRGKTVIILIVINR